MNKNFGEDMTVGSIPKHLLSFSIPMLFGNLLQVGYSFINAIWVGNIVGHDAIGATAVSFPIILTLIGIAAGLSTATTILVSQYYGAKDLKMVEKVVNNSFSIACILGLAFTLVSILSSDFLLRLINTPEEIFQMASAYLKISLSGFILLYMSSLIASILRGIGDTKTPLIFMAIGVGINAILDPIFIKGIGIGLNGAAVASLISQAISLILSIIYLNRKGHIVSMNPANFILDKNITLILFKIGLPSIVQQCMPTIGSAFITSFVNAFGASATNAFGAASRIDQIAYMPAISMSMSVAALTGQNLGADKPERVKEIFKWGIIITTAVTLCISLFTSIYPEIILKIFDLNGADLEIGVTYLHIIGSTYIFFSIMIICIGLINGSGQTMITMLFSILSLWGIRVPFSAILSRTSLGLEGIWISVSASFGIIMLVSLCYYYSGRWNKSILKNKPIDSHELEGI